MPIYEYLCPYGHKFDGYAPMSKSANPAFCEKHAAVAPKIISAPRVFGDYEPYVSPVTGRLVHGKKDRERDLRESGCRPYEAGELQEQARRAADAEKQAEREIDDAVERTFNELRY